MRSLASFLAEANPDVMALGEIDAGDALALATRFAREWAYRGGLALLWNERVAAHAVHDLYLPYAPPAIERRGLLRIDAEYAGSPLTLVATRFGTDRSNVREMRFARAQARTARGPALVFVASPLRSVGFADLGFDAIGDPECGEVEIAARGFALERLDAATPGAGVGAALLARAWAAP